MIRANNLLQLEGPRNVGEFGENGEFGKSGDFVNVGEKIISEYIWYDWLEGPQKDDEFILKEPTKFTGKSQKLVITWKIW